MALLLLQKQAASAFQPLLHRVLYRKGLKSVLQKVARTQKTGVLAVYTGYLRNIVIGLRWVVCGRMR